MAFEIEYFHERVRASTSVCVQRLNRGRSMSLQTALAWSNCWSNTVLASAFRTRGLSVKGFSNRGHTGDQCLAETVGHSAG